MRKIASIGFSAMLAACLVLTCATGIRSIGKDLYLYYGSLGTMGVLDSLDKLFSTIEKTVTNNFVLRDECVDIYGLIQRLEGKKIVEDAVSDKTVLKGSDGKLYFRGAVTNGESAHDDGLDKKSLSKNADKVIELKNFCDSNDTKLLYVTAPHKYASSAVDLPEQKSDYLDDTIFFSQKLTAAGVPNLNLMTELLEGERPYSDGFFVTDHHWNIKTAFWGFQRICDSLKRDCNIPIDEKLYAQESFSVETCPNVFLGSMGARAGKYYAGMDAIDVISPRYSTEFQVDFHTKTLGTTVHREGNFTEAILDDKISYNMYITSDNALIHVRNQERPNGKRVLLLKDSFGVPVSAWLACCCDELWVMDLRYAQEESVEDFIVEHGIDAAVCLYNPEVLRSELFYNFTEMSSGK